MTEFGMMTDFDELCGFLNQPAGNSELGLGFSVEPLD